ncbi:MAG: VanW family protein [Thermomicrobiales bacterium]
MAQKSLTQPPGSPFAGIWPFGAATDTSSSHTKLGHVASRIVLACALIAIAAAGSLLAFRVAYADEIYPGVHVGGIDVGGMTRADAAAAIQARADEITAQRAYFDGFDQHWAPTLADLGVTVDLEASIDQAMAIGREASSADRLGSAISSLSGEHSLPIVLTIDSDKTEAWSMSVDQQINLIPHDAELVVQDGKISVVPEANGTIVDQAALQSSLLTSLQTMQAPTESLPTVDKLPSVHATDLVAVESALTAALSAPVKVTYGSQSWTIDPVDFGQFVSTSIDPAKTGAEAVSIAVDNEALASWLSTQFAASVDSDPKNAKVAWDGTKLKAIEASVDGAKIRPQTMAEMVSASFLGDHSPVEIPVTVLKPEVDGNNLDALGITTKLGVGSSNFDGSDDARATNITVGAELLNGTLIPPHGTFSFNHSIGVIGPELGFVEGQVIDGEKIGRDYGGGICQVSTTVFRAAFFSGMPIVEGWPHRWRLGFYELDDWTPGLDASIMQPEGDPFGGGDFRFENPSDSWMLVESYVDYPRVFVILYGADLGYTVDISDPVFGETYEPLQPSQTVDPTLPAGTIIQTEWAAEGLDITYYRTVYGADGDVVLEDDWVTNFYARGDVYKVSPDMAGQT